MRLNGHRFLADPTEDLGAGPWTPDQYFEMDAKFTAALEAAFAAGLESRASAAAQVALPASRSGPRWTTPLTKEIQEGLWRSSAASALVFVAR
jgi:hypothetical protein